MNIWHLERETKPKCDSVMLNARISVSHEDGGTMVEYGLMLALFAAIFIAVTALFG